MTKIEWAHAGLGQGETWNPIRANNDPMGSPTRIGWHCEKVSPACANCYAERQNMAGARGGTRYPYKAAHRKNGSIQVYLDEKTLLAPLRWKTPRGIFVCSMTDVFGDWVLDEWLDKIFAVAALCPQHIFIFLTKRPKRMREYVNTYARFARILEARVSLPNFDHALPKNWPLPNIWFGVTAEDQQRANERIPDLLGTPAAIRFVSCEPLLGAVDLRRINFQPNLWIDCIDRNWPERFAQFGAGRGLDLVITGGETGPGARPTHIDWERSIRNQCAAADVAYFRKQIGEWKAVCEMSQEEIDACYHPAPESAPDATRRAKVRSIVMHRDGAVFDNPIASGAFEGGKGAMTMFRVGRRRAGHLLDGKAHHEFPDYERRR